MKNNWKKIAQRGSMMVEALAMLGLITMVTPVLYKKAAERTTELQDINTATQMRTLSKALDDFIQDNYNDLAEGPEGEATVNKDDIVPYLPYNFNIDESKLFNEFKFAIRNELINKNTDKEHSAITGVVLAPTASDLPMIRAAKIASMVGANGGVVRSNEIQGVQGGWAAPLDDFGLGTAPDGSLVTSSVHAVTSAGGGADSKHVLYRDDSKGIEYNTMQTTLYMGGNDIDEVKTLKPLNDTIELAAKVTTQDLDVSGSAVISGNLTAADASIANLIASGTANIAGAITGSSTATLADKLTVSGGGADITGNTKVTGDTEITGAATIGGGAVVSGAAKKGDAAVKDGENTEYSLVSEGNLLVQKNAHVTGDVKIDQALIANSLYGELGIGGGKISDGNYNFVANANDVSVAGNSFQVGSDANPRIQTDNTSVQMNSSGYMFRMEEGGVALADKDASKSIFLMTDANVAIASGMVSLEDGENNNSVNVGDGNAITLTSNNKILATASQGGMQLDGSGAKIGYYGSGSFSGPNLNIVSDSAVLTGGKGSAGINTPKISLQNGDVDVIGDSLLVNTNNIDIDEDDIVFDSSASIPDSAEATNYANRTSGIRINREGIVQLPVGGTASRSNLATSSGDQGKPGYIKLDRILANQAYPKFDNWGPGKGAYDIGTAANERYDAYQVNPAYTSVMHDIKLTTRGGARLSDILPDFINKGIYVLDNTYREEKGKEQWEKYTVTVGSNGSGFTVSGAPGDCTSSTCIASPWLGFVPTPQCPPGYSKVITISPIRWKMSEAYYVAGAEPTAGDASEKFRNYFLPLTDPTKAHFELESVVGNTSHTHQVSKGWPLTFQTNTWLNTTISGVKVNGSSGTAEDSGSQGPGRNQTFVGWHAIMGFLYYANDYQEYLAKLGQNLKDVVVWNLFPVYNEEMTAIANVYCYFERRRMTDAPAWEWDSDYVDTGYNQLTNFRFGFTKNNSNYNNRLNDPALKYKEVW